MRFKIFKPMKVSILAFCLKFIHFIFNSQPNFEEKVKKTGCNLSKLLLLTDRLIQIYDAKYSAPLTMASLYLHYFHNGNSGIDL